MPKIPQSPDLEQRALEALRSPGPPLAELMALAAALKAQRSFEYARRLFARARMRDEVATHLELRLKLAQEEALCTYQDPDQPATGRYDRALEILAEVEDLNTTRNQETLGLVVAIYKRQWEQEAQVENLYRAAAYYQRGHDEGIAPDFGYMSINAAFTHDLLAYQEEIASPPGGPPPACVSSRRTEAAQTRREVIDVLQKLAARDPQLQNHWWFQKFGRM